MSATRQLAAPVLAALSAATFDGNRLLLTGQLDRKLFGDVAKVIEMAGGKWNRSAKAHLFANDAADAIEPILLTGEIQKQSTKQLLGKFYSPPLVVDRIMALAEVQPGMRVLEPSAGIGRIAEAAVRAGTKVHAIDIDRDACAALASLHEQLEPTGLGFGSILRADFLTHSPIEAYDRVLMNPPFAKQADIDHVTHALRFLKPGGRLISVMSAAVRFREDRKAREFRALIDRMQSVFTEDLPRNAFQASGTSVNTIILTVQA